MPYEVKLHPEVAKTFAAMPPKLRAIIIRALRTLQTDPFQPRSGTDIIRLKEQKEDRTFFA